jgi:hypothetical protein
LGYNNRLDQKSLGSVVATGFLLGVLSFLCALSHMERIAHRSTDLPRISTLRGHTTNGKKDMDFSTGSATAKWLRVTASEQSLHV